MIYYKTPEQIEFIRENCLLVCKTLSIVGEMIKPGITGKKIDEAAEAFIRDHGAVPGFKGYNGFPAALCVSVNEAVVHGIPNGHEFQDGDIVSVDCGVHKNDFFGDAAFTFAIGEVKEETMKLLEVTNESLYLGIDAAISGNRVGDIGFAVQYYVEKKYGYSVVRELVGHGIGKNLHESPEIPNYGKRGRGQKLKEGLVIAIEPMVNMGRKDIRQSDDGWTVITKDKLPSAHYEHTVAITNGKADILSDHSSIFEAIKNNPDVKILIEWAKQVTLRRKGLA